MNGVDRDAPLPAEGPTPRAILRAENVAKRFGATQALDDVTFEVHAGEINALLGENGAGKSTLVRIMAGVVAPDSGRISSFFLRMTAIYRLARGAPSPSR